MINTPMVDSILNEVYDNAIQLVRDGTQDEEMKDESQHTNDEELCAICYTSELSAEPCVTLNCGHKFHRECVIQLI